jgi:hypothetical protein
MHEKFFLVNPMVLNHSQDLGVSGEIVLEYILEKWGWEVWTGLVWLRIGTSRRLL